MSRKNARMSERLAQSPVPMQSARLPSDLLKWWQDIGGRCMGLGDKAALGS